MNFKDALGMNQKNKLFVKKNYRNITHTDFNTHFNPKTTLACKCIVRIQPQQGQRKWLPKKPNILSPLE